MGNFITKIEIKDDKALLLLNELLPEYERFLYSDSWETSDIREELNSQFYNGIFHHFALVVL